jgi:hypothetical protein
VSEKRRAREPQLPSRGAQKPSNRVYGFGVILLFYMLNSSVGRQQQSIIIEEMKVLIFSLMILAGLSLRLDLSSNTVINDLNNFFSLSCQQAQGSVKYSFQGLPQGFELKNDQIVYSGPVSLQGQFPVKITASDASGQSDSQIVLLNVNLSGQASAGYANAGSLASVNNILSSISTVSTAPASSSTTTTSSSTSSSSSSSGSSSSSTAGAAGSSPASGAQILTLNGVSYNFGNSLSLNLNGNNGGAVSSGNVSPSQINNLVGQYSTSSATVSTTQNISAYPSTIIVAGQLPNSIPNTKVLTITT